MRLDIDCVRDVLMAVEQKGFGQSYTISNLHDLLDYSSDQIEYTCLKLSEAGYLDISPLDLGENARRDMVMTLEDEFGIEVPVSYTHLTLPTIA